MPRWRGPGDKRWSRALKAAGLPDRYKTWRLPPQPETLPGRHPSFPRRPLRGGGCGAAPRALPPPVSRSRPRSRFCPARGGLRCSRGGARAARGLVCPLGLGKARCSQPPLAALSAKIGKSCPKTRREPGGQPARCEHESVGQGFRLGLAPASPGGLQAPQVAAW